MTFKNILWLDFETRSRVNLKKHGAYRYVQCPAHRILVAGWALNDGPTRAAILGPNGEMPDELSSMLADPGVQIRAHNAAFDRLQLGKRAPPIERWYCTAAQARGGAMPGKLEDLGRALGTALRKDPRGKDLMAALSIPARDGSGTFSDDPKLMHEYAIYCGLDIGTMREASLGLPELRDEDLAVYHASERINDRGLPIDTELCLLATQYATVEAAEAAEAVVELSGGALKTVRGTKLRDWVYERLGPVMRKHMELYRRADPGTVQKGSGLGGSAGRDTAKTTGANAVGARATKKTSLAADIRATLLAIAEDEPDAFLPEVVEMLEAAEAGSMSSTAKFQTMLDRVSDDGRLRGAFVFNGAYQTNRWSSTGAQVHNFPRLVAKDPEAVLAIMRTGAPLDGTLRTLKSMLRPAIAPKRGRVIVRADWNAVEARGLPWLADNPGSREYMAAFSDDTRDVYVEQSHAAGLGGERQPGKVVVLSLGYGGGEGALAKMAKNYGVKIADGDGVVRRWRAANGWVAHKKTGWWASLMRCAMQAVEHPNRSYRAGRVLLQMQGSSLTMLLPSGRTMHYPKAAVVEGEYGPEIQYLKASWKPKADAKGWPVARLWHGVLAENATQAACADLLRDALVQAERQGLEVLGHVHDEIITESPVRSAKAKGRALQASMLTSRRWSVGLPLKAEVDISPRFRK